MKIQDIIFAILFVLLLYKRNPQYLAAAGFVCLIISIPLFALWIFFTAERLTWYSAAFFLASCILLLIQLRKDNNI